MLIKCLFLNARRNLSGGSLQKERSMTRLASVFGLAAMAAASIAGAQDMKPVPAEGAPVALYHAVKVTDYDNIAPCAEPLVVQIVDPCWRPDPCNPCCKPPCVNVMVCVPKQQCCQPCDPCCKDRGPRISTSRDGRKVRYDYGKYAVELVAKNGYVHVDYDD